VTNRWKHRAAGVASIVIVAATLQVISQANAAENGSARATRPVQQAQKPLVQGKQSSAVVAPRERTLSIRADVSSPTTKPGRATASPSRVGGQDSALAPNSGTTVNIYPGKVTTSR
jgi:hypothetical protein